MGFLALGLRLTSGNLPSALEIGTHLEGKFFVSVLFLF